MDVAADNSMKCPQVSGNCEQDSSPSDRMQAMPDSRVLSFGLMFCLHQETEKNFHPIKAQRASGGVVTCGDNTLRRDEPVTLLALGLQKATETSNHQLGHRDAGG